MPKQAIREGVNQKARTGMGYGIELILRLESGIWLEGQSISIECRDLCSYQAYHLQKDLWSWEVCFVYTY